MYKLMPALLFSFFLTACATLDAEKAKESLMRLEDLNPSEVIFSEGGEFAVAMQGAQNATFEGGLIAISNENIYFLTEAKDLGEFKKRFSMRVDAFNKVGLKEYGRGRQVQVLSDNISVVFSATKGSEFVDQEATERAYRILTSLGLEKFSPDYFINPDVSEDVFFPVFLPE